MPTVIVAFVFFNVKKGILSSSQLGEPSSRQRSWDKKEREATGEEIDVKRESEVRNRWGWDAQRQAE
jgi:hypothetical protein